MFEDNDFDQIDEYGPFKIVWWKKGLIFLMWLVSLVLFFPLKAIRWLWDAAEAERIILKNAFLEMFLVTPEARKDFKDNLRWNLRVKRVQKVGWVWRDKYDKRHVVTRYYDVVARMCVQPPYRDVTVDEWPQHQPQRPIGVPEDAEYVNFDLQAA